MWITSRVIHKVARLILEPASNAFTSGMREELNLPFWLDDTVPLPRACRTLPRVITRAEAAQAGIGASTAAYRCRSGQWQRMAPGVYLTAPPVTRQDRVWAAAHHGGPRAVVSGAAALAEYGFRIRPVARELTLVPVESGVRAWGSIIVRPTGRLPEAAVRPGPPLAPVARAVADHVLTLRRLSDVHAVLGAAIQQGVCTVAELAVELEAGPQRGSRPFREALQDVGYNAHSAPEARAGRWLRAAGVRGFEQNGRITVGRRVYVGDFVWRTRRAVLELDSVEFHFRVEDQEATLLRDQALQLAGWTVLHVKPSQLRDGAAFTELVRAWLDALGSRSA